MPKIKVETEVSVPCGLDCQKGLMSSVCEFLRKRNLVRGLTSPACALFGVRVHRHREDGLSAYKKCQPCLEACKRAGGGA